MSGAAAAAKILCSVSALCYISGDFRLPKRLLNAGFISELGILNPALCDICWSQIAFLKHRMRYCEGSKED